MLLLGFALGNNPVIVGKSTDWQEGRYCLYPTTYDSTEVPYVFIEIWVPDSLREPQIHPTFFHSGGGFYVIGTNRIWPTKDKNVFIFPVIMLPHGVTANQAYDWGWELWYTVYETPDPRDKPDKHGEIVD